MHLQYTSYTLPLLLAAAVSLALLFVFRDITAHKRAEKALRESRARFRDLFENANDLIQSVAPDGSFIYVNRAWRETLGYTEEDLSDLSLQDIIHPEDQAPCRQVFWQVTSSGKSVNRLETKFLTKDGEAIVVEGSVNCNFDEAGNPVATRAIFRDITERKRTEERLARLHECFLSFGPDPLENINRVTALCGELLGATCALYNRLDQGMLCSWGQWNTPPDYDPVDEPDGHICYDVIRQAGEDVMVVRNLPETRYAETDPNVTPYGLQTYVGQAVKFGGDYVGSLCAVFQEDFEPTTEEKWLLGVTASAVAVEEKRKQAEEELQQERDFASAVLETAGALVVVLDPQGRIVRFNRACERTTGYSSEEVRGKHLWNLLLTPEEIESVKAIFQDLKASHGPNEHENYWVTKDGRRRLISWSNTTFTDSDGSVQYVIGTGIDITERRRAEEERKYLLAAEREQRELSEAQRDSAAALNSTLDLDQVLERVLANVGRVVPHDTAEVFLIENGIAHLVRSRGFEDMARSSPELRLSISDTRNLRKMVENGIPLAIPDTKDYDDWVEVSETRWVRSYAGAPIHARGEIIGFIDLLSTTPDFYTDTHAQRLQTFANQAGTALENAQLLDETRRRAAHQEALNAIIGAAAAAPNLPQLLQSVLQHTLQALEVSMGAMWVADQHAIAGLEPEFGDILHQAVQDTDLDRPRHTVVTEDWQKAEGADFPHAIAATLEQFDIRSSVFVPVLAGGRHVGSLALAAPRPRNWGPDEVKLAEAVGQQLGAAAERLRLFAATEEHAALMSQLVPLSEELNRPRIQPEVLEAIAQGTLTLSDSQRIAIYLREPSDDVTVAWSQGLSEAYLEQALAQARELPGGQLLHSTEPTLIADVENLPEEAPLRSLAKDEDYQAVALWPLVYEGTVLAAVACYYDEPHAWSEAEQETMQAFCRQAAIALENARLFEETRQRQDELAALYQTSLETAAKSTSREDIQPLLQRIVERATELLGGDGGGLYLADAEGQSATCVVSHRTPEDYTGVTLQQGEGAAGTVLETGEPLVVDDYRAWSKQAAAFDADQPFRSVISVPLQWADRVTGILHVLDFSGTRKFDRGDLRMLEMFAHHAATAIEYSRRLESERRWALELETLHQMALDVTTQLELPGLLEVVVQRATDLLGAKGGAIYLYHPDQRELEVVVSRNQEEDYTGRRLRLGEGLSGKAVEQQRPLTVDDYGTWADRAEEQYGDAPFTAIIAVPLQIGERVLGVLNITEEAEGRTFDADDVRLAMLFASQAAVALENARLYQELEDAYLDTILALANAVDARDAYTGDHSQQLAQWVAATGRELGCSEKQLETLRWAALLHDIGKIGIPDSILQKPGPLTEKEKVVIERHPQIGEKIVAQVKQLAHVAPIIRAHQERWDGTGYPDGLAGEEIPLEARILAVVDAYGAMTDERVYREALSHEEAVDELQHCAGTQFDPQAVEAFLQVVEEAEET